MGHVLKLNLEKERSTLVLLRDGVLCCEQSWPEARDMGTRLFQAIADMLHEQGLQPTDVEEFVVESHLPDVYTSARIAETVKKVYTFGSRKK